MKAYNVMCDEKMSKYFHSVGLASFKYELRECFCQRFTFCCCLFYAIAG